MSKLEEVLEYKAHKWSGWPGAYCTVCGREDKVEQCRLNHSEDCRCVNESCPGIPAPKLQKEEHPKNNPLVQSFHTYQSDQKSAVMTNLGGKLVCDPTTGSNYWKFESAYIEGTYDNKSKNATFTIKKEDGKYPGKLDGGVFTDDGFYGNGRACVRMMSVLGTHGLWVTLEHCPKCNKHFELRYKFDSGPFPPKAEPCPVCG